MAFPLGHANSPNCSSPLTTLREAGHILQAYIDYIFNMGLTFKEWLDNVIETVSLLESLGYIICLDKSKFIPSQVIRFLRFVIDSVLMKVYLTTEQKARIKKPVSVCQLIAGIPLDM